METDESADEVSKRLERRARDKARRRRAEAAAKQRREAVEQGPRYDPGGEQFPSEAKMLARLESFHDRTWSATGTRPDIMRHAHGKGSGSTRERRADY